MLVLFAFDDFHPLGGPADAVGVYEDLEQAKRVAEQPWGRRRPVDYDNCELWSIDNGDGHMRPVAEYSSGRWVEIPDVVPS